MTETVDRPVGVALIGTGMWGRRLADALQRTTALRLVCCYSRDEARRRAFAADFRCQAAPSFEAAVDHPEVEGVLLATPNYVHREQALACAERRRHVFVEKGPLMQLGVHHADTLQYLLGPVVRVRGAFARLVTSAEVDDVAVGALEFAAGAQGTLTSSYVSPRTYSLRLYGTAAVLDYQTEMAARCVRGTARPETGAAEALAALRVVLAAVRSHELGAAAVAE
jgi:predicted dehydrogenase